MTCQRLAFSAADQNLYPIDSGDTRSQSLHQRSHGEFFYQDPGTMTVSEGITDIDYRQPGIDQVHVAHLGTGAQRMGGRLVQIQTEQRPQ